MMEEFVAQVLGKMDGDMSKLNEAFGPELSQRDELLLTKLYEDLGLCVERMMDKVLCGAESGGEMIMDQRARSQVMELTSIRKSIHQLLNEQGQLGLWSESLN